MKQILLFVAGAAAIAASYAAATFGLVNEPAFGPGTVVSIIMPGLVTALVIIIYLRERVRLHATLGTVSELNARLIRKDIEIEHLSAVDQLTGLYTRRHFDEYLHAEFERSRRHHRVLSLILIEVDDLADVGERTGQLGKGFLLSEIAGMVRTTLRVNDIAGRYTGDTLALLLPETNETQARAVGAKLQADVRANKFIAQRYDAPLRLTLTQGVATIPSSQIHSAAEFTQTAELSLYAAKGEPEAPPEPLAA